MNGRPVTSLVMRKRTIVQVFSGKTSFFEKTLLQVHSACHKVQLCRFWRKLIFHSDSSFTISQEKENPVLFMALTFHIWPETNRGYTLRTLLAEVENIINSRHLTHVSLDYENAEALTPNHFLIGPKYLATIPVQTDDKDLCLLSKWKAVQRLTDCFWKRWLQEYLPTLVRREKWLSHTRNLNVGSVVLVADPNSPRHSWPRGKVEAVYPGKDGIVRVVNVKTSNGIFRRPVSKICALDVEKKSGN